MVPVQRILESRPRLGGRAAERRGRKGGGSVDGSQTDGVLGVARQVSHTNFEQVEGGLCACGELLLGIRGPCPVHGVCEER